MVKTFNFQHLGIEKLFGDSIESGKVVCLSLFSILVFINVTWDCKINMRYWWFIISGWSAEFNSRSNVHYYFCIMYYSIFVDFEIDSHHLWRYDEQDCPRWTHRTMILHRLNAERQIGNIILCSTVHIIGNCKTIYPSLDSKSTCEMKVAWYNKLLTT